MQAICANNAKALCRMPGLDAVDENTSALRENRQKGDRLHGKLQFHIFNSNVSHVQDTLVGLN